jgi:hypothetical protein
MGFLNQLFRPAPARLVKLPAGSFTVDRTGSVITSTLPQTFPPASLQEMGRAVLAYFQGAQQAQIPVRELIVHYPVLRLSARELRGGAIIFLRPLTLAKT